MAKTTKLVRGIHSWIKFQKHQGVESLSIEGKQALADLSQDKNGDTNLILNADKDKVNTVASSVPFLAVAHTTTGTNPNQEKTATISHDLTQFNLGSDGLIDISKTETSITLYTGKIKEFVNNTLSAKEEELKEFVIDQTSGAVGVSPTYVEEEIRKAKEETLLKITQLSKHHFTGKSPYKLVKVKTNIILNDENYVKLSLYKDGFNDTYVGSKVSLTMEHNTLVNNASESVKILEEGGKLVFIINFHNDGDNDITAITAEYHGSYTDTLEIEMQEEKENFDGYVNPTDNYGGGSLDYHPNPPLEGNVPTPLPPQ